MDVQINRASQYDKRTQKNDLKGHADRIIQGIKKIGPNHAKRAIWELFQNAVDLSEHCEIKVKVTNDELIFSHNGVPFTMHTLDCLFTQVSSKTLTEKKLDREEADPIGQYGTGFMTSHSFGDVVKVSGAIKDEFEGEDSKTNSEGHIKFENLVIDRSTQDWEKLCDEISKLRNQVKELLNHTLTFEELPATDFRFGFNNDLNRKRAFEAIESLKTILPYVMIFNDRLKKVTVTDIQDTATIYQKDDSEESTEHFFSQVIRINDEVRKINYLKTDRLTIALPFTSITNEDDYFGKANALPDSLPKLFLFYPLIGTEAFGFNFVIHSKNFQPTEPRDGLHLNSENEKNKVEEEANQKLMEEASQLIFDFLENNLSRIKQPHFFAEINFAISLDNQELSDYFKSLKDTWTAKFRTLPFIETLSDPIAAKDAVFLDSYVIDGAETETLAAIYNIAGRFFTNLPKPDLIPIWTKLTDEWNVPEIDRIGFADIAEKIQESGTIESFDKEELILLYKEMIRKGEGELFANKALLPNIKGEFRKQVELSKSVELTDELIEIADVINPKISNRQIEPYFLLEGLEFERFGRKDYMGLINASLDEHVKDGTCSHELPENYLASLMQYASIVSREDSVSGPVRVIKLIAAHYDLTLNQLVLPTLPGDDNIDVRKGQFDFFKIYLNDISNKDKEWVETNIDALAQVLNEAFSSADVKKFFLRYDVYPNQLFQLKPITSLHKDSQIPDFVKVLYDKVVAPNEPVKSKLAHSVIKNLYDEMKSTSSLDLTRQIEQKFFGESGNEIHMEDHPFKSDIIDIIRNFKQDQPQWETYEKIFPATHRNKSAILVQLADGEASFTILSQSEDVIKKLAGIADHPNLDELLKLGEDALRQKLQDEAEWKYKKKIGNHLEDVLRKHLGENINATITSEQDGQDLVIYIEDKAVYYIEVKSKWLETTPIRISRNQTLRADENPDCFALCSIDMTKYTGADKYEIESVDSIVQYMKFNTDVGSKVGHLVDIYSNAHQVDKFSLDGDYRTLIPAKYIQEGIDLADFEKSLIEDISNKYGK
ncbi:sacsin N-terminal ATP-binding-like domain-containing protein [Xanthomarina gelatinilytica]|uniref:sacsin N-terminal ATP-binding-like domain-containing protein n=1 Tax=Xanthomarina gelatinilytica TaxID=1137281 RepID=UPI003AA8FAE7